MSFELLPSEIIVFIFEKFSTYVELYRHVYIICKNWNQLVEESTLVKNFTVKEIGEEIDLKAYKEKYKIRQKVKSFFSTNYPKWNLEEWNFNDSIEQGILHEENNITSLVKENHPVIIMFNEARIQKGQQPANKNQIIVKSNNNYYKVDRRDLEKLMRRIKI